MLDHKKTWLFFKFFNFENSAHTLAAFLTNERSRAKREGKSTNGDACYAFF